jgi:RimJ/RimL family protein N-acetyltransferase
MILLTNRLLLREFAPADAAAVHLYASDPQVTSHMIWGPNTVEDTDAFLSRAVDTQLQQPRTVFELAVVVKATDELIGAVSLHATETGQAELGYCLNRQYWRQGFASEAASAMVAFGFGELGLHRICAKCRPDNIGSAKVLQHIGMTREGHMREHMWYKGEWHDSLLYSILRREFER